MVFSILINSLDSISENFIEISRFDAKFATERSNGGKIEKKKKKEREMGKWKAPKNRKNHHPYLWSDSKDEDPMTKIPPMFL